MISDVQISNLYTMACTAKLDPRQAIPPTRTMPPEDVRLLRARLLLEETIETIHGLGFALNLNGQPVVMNSVVFNPGRPVGGLQLEEVIDGCADLIYVAVGTLCSLGVPDSPHLMEVCRANDAKFPNGEPVMHATVPGKYGKPEGWEPPNHSPGHLYDEGFSLQLVDLADYPDYPEKT